MSGPRAGAATAARPDQRARILAAAVDLMSARGVSGMSMRQLANACELNVATLYHYFPAKSELLRAIIADRGYEQLLRHASVPVDPALPPRRRLVQLLTRIWHDTLGERSLWRLLIGESLRGEAEALDVVHDLAAALEDAIDRWLGASFPELPPDHRDTSVVVTGQLLGFFLEALVLPPDDAIVRLRRRAKATAAVVFPD